MGKDYFEFAGLRCKELAIDNKPLRGHGEHRNTHRQGCVPPLSLSLPIAIGSGSKKPNRIAKDE